MTTICFLDSSALTKLFVNESASQLLRMYIDTLADDDKVFSVLAEVEVRSALQRRLRNAELTVDQHSSASAKMGFVSNRWIRLPIDDLVLDLAFGVIARHALRSLDALQLASALTMKDGLESGDDLLFIASDKRLLAAAAAEGLAVWNPETSTPPAALPPVN